MKTQQAQQVSRRIEDASRASGLSYRSSEQCIDTFLKSIKLSLQSGETVFIPHIGTIDDTLKLSAIRTISPAKRLTL
jgi:nucleoid DNA-binding protein